RACADLESTRTIPLRGGELVAGVDRRRIERERVTKVPARFIETSASTRDETESDHRLDRVGLIAMQGVEQARGAAPVERERSLPRGLDTRAPVAIDQLGMQA